LGKDVSTFQAAAVLSESDIDKILKDIFNGSEEIPEELFQATYKHLSEGIDVGYGEVKTPDDAMMVYQLKNNVAVFSAFKSNHYGSTMRALLVDENDKKRTWGEFKKVANEIDPKYNQLWLAAEYNMATRQARSAEQWQNFKRDQDTYPNLEYMPSRSAEPRDAHTKLYGTIAPIDHPFWSTALPPNGWGCKCWVKQTREPSNVSDEDTPEPIPGIEGNAGKTGRVFSASHAFVTAVKKEDKAGVLKALNEYHSKQNDIIEYKIGKNAITIPANAHQDDLIQNVRFLTPFVKKYKEDYALRSHVETGIKGDTNPELQKGKSTGDLTTWNTAQDAYSYIKTNWKDKHHIQMKKFDDVFVAFDFNGKLTDKNYSLMWRALYGEMVSADRVQFVLLKNGDKVYKINKKNLDGKAELAKIKKELL